jgi:N-acetylglucosamine-6-phosphate deacetylase
MADGGYTLGGLDVEVAGGVARLAGGGSIAGGTATAAQVFRHAVAAGVGLVDAARLAATTPARLLGLGDRGAVSPGLRADLVLLDDELNVRSVVT